MIDSPSQWDFEGMVHGNMVQNFPMTTDDVTDANKIFGSDLVGIQRKTARSIPDKVNMEYVSISKDSVSLHKKSL